MFSTKTLLFTTLALSTVACAPRVSRRSSETFAAAQPAPMAARPVQETRSSAMTTAMVQPQKSEPAPAQTVKAEPAPVVVAQPAKVVQVKATPEVAHDDEAEEENDAEDAGYAPSEAKTSANKKSFYSFSDNEITAMRRKSREFKKLHDKLNTCTSKSEKTIAKREQLRDKIIALQNTEYRTPKQDKELSRLRADERKMLSTRADASGGCQELEARLTDMLRGGVNT